MLASAPVGDRTLDGIDLLRFDDEGRICEMAVYVRRFSGSRLARRCKIPA